MEFNSKPKLPKLNFSFKITVSNIFSGPLPELYKINAIQIIAPNIKRIPWIASVQTTACIPPKIEYIATIIPVKIITETKSKPKKVFNVNPSR